MLLVLKTKMIVWTTETKKLKEIKKLLSDFVASDWLQNDILFMHPMLFLEVFLKTVQIYIVCCFFFWSFQNYRQRYAYIITEMPQVHTIIDFCRLLQQEECRTIVMLNSGFTDTQVHVQFRVCYSVIIIIPYEKLITNW